MAFAAVRTVATAAVATLVSTVAAFLDMSVATLILVACAALRMRRDFVVVSALLAAAIKIPAPAFSPPVFLKLFPRVVPALEHVDVIVKEKFIIQDHGNVMVAIRKVQTIRLEL